MKKFICVGIVCNFYINIGFAVPHNIVSANEELIAPITTLNTDTLDKNQWSISQRTEFFRTTPLSDATLLQSPLFESQTGLLINYLLAGYGVTDDLTIGISIPTQTQYNFRGAGVYGLFDEGTQPSLTSYGNTSGLSDTLVFALWRMADISTTKANISVAAIMGINTPTGKTNSKTSNGELFAVADQSGNGAVSPFGGIIFTKKFGELALSSNLLYTKTTTGSQDTILGSYVDYYLAGVYPLIKTIRIKSIEFDLEGILEFNGEYMVKDKISGINDPNTGGNTITLMPGARLNIGKNISTYFGVGIPLIQALYGTQVKTSYSIVSGIDFVF
jgi:hypothetical protein